MHQMRILQAVQRTLPLSILLQNLAEVIQKVRTVPIL